MNRSAIDAAKTRDRSIYRMLLETLTLKEQVMHVYTVLYKRLCASILYNYTVKREYLAEGLNLANWLFCFIPPIL